MIAVVIALTIVVALMLVLLTGLLRSHAEILRSLHDLGVSLDDDHGDQTFRVRARPAAATDAAAGPIPDDNADLRASRGIIEAVRPVDDPASLGTATDIGGVTPDGESAVVGITDAAQPTLLAFLSSGCATCHEFWDAFAQGVALDFDGRPVRIVVVTKGPELESPGSVASLTTSTITTIMSTEAFEAYGVELSPYFVLVDAHGDRIVGEGVASSWPQLAMLLDRAVEDAGGAGSFGARRTRREVLGGGVRQGSNIPRSVDEILAESGIGPDHHSLHQPSRRPQTDDS